MLSRTRIFDRFHQVNPAEDQGEAWVGWPFADDVEAHGGRVSLVEDQIQGPEVCSL